MPTLDAAATKELHHLFWICIRTKFKAFARNKGLFKENVQGKGEKPI